MSKAVYNKLKPFYKSVLENKMTCTDISKKTNISYCCVVTNFSKYLVELSWELKGNPVKIKAVFKLPDGNINTYGGDNKLIDDFCGKYSKTLYNRIKKLSDENTKWNGF